jgi:hypothetical protein
MMWAALGFWGTRFQWITESAYFGQVSPKLGIVGPAAFFSENFYDL